MPIPLAAIPNLDPTRINAPGINLGAMNAPTEGVSQLVRGITQAAGAFQQHADRIQAMDNTFLESKARTEISQLYSQFETGLDTNTDPATYLPKLEETLTKTRQFTQAADLPPSVRDRLALHHSQFEESARIRIAERAANMTTKRASIALQNEMDAAMTYRDRNAFTSAVDRGVEGGLILPEQRDKLTRSYEEQDAFETMRETIEQDPDTALDWLRGDTQIAHLTPENRERLTHYAEQKANHAKAETWDQITLQSLNGDVLTKDDIMALANDGTITPAQAGSYLRAYHAPAPPDFDPDVFDAVRSAIHAYDPAKDPTGAVRATLSAQIGTVPLPPEHIKELQNQFKTRAYPTEEQAKKHKLATPFLDRIESEWKAEAFGMWFDMEKDPQEGRIARKIIRPKDWERALSYKNQLTDAFTGWLAQQPADIDPIEAGRKYDEIKSQILRNSYTPDLTIPTTVPVPQFEDPLEGTTPDGSPGVLPPAEREDPKTSRIGTFGGQPILPPGIPYRRAATSVFGGNADPEDNGLSANGGSNNATAGVAIPQKMLQAMFPGKDKAWHFKNVKVMVKADNGTTRVLPLVDYGTAEWVTEREGRHKLDLNPKAVAALGGTPIYKNGKLTSHAGFQTVDFTITTDNAANIDPKTTSLDTLKKAWFADKKPTHPDQIISGLAALTESFYSA